MNAPAADCNAARLAQAAVSDIECGQEAGRARLEIEAGKLPAGVYQVGCSVTTFLGLSKSAAVVIEKNASHTIPAVMILGMETI